MRVITKSGQFEPVDFNKIVTRLDALCNLPGERVLDLDVADIAQHTIKMMVDGISTLELDAISSKYCAASLANDPAYGELAARIEVDNLHRDTSSDYYTAVLACESYTNGDSVVRLLAPKLVAFAKHWNYVLNLEIDYCRDFRYDYFGVRTLMKSYLLKHKVGNGMRIMERPQHMCMRVAVGIHFNEIGVDGGCSPETLESIIRTYHLMSTKKYTHATPTLFNAGTARQALSSCFLLSVDDSIEDIYETLAKTAYISKWSGGIGIHVSQVRAKNALIKSTNGLTEGIVPMLGMFNKSSLFISQGGNKRKGSTAVYLEMWHPDIFEFLDLKKPLGDENLRARDLFLALWVCDVFMERLDKSLSSNTPVMWSLFCPSKAPGLADVYGDEYRELYHRYESAKLWNRQVDIRELWEHVLSVQMESGVPYISFKDHVNRKNNQNNLGTIKSSNLCVHGDTRVLTTAGWEKISDLAGSVVDVWNGEVFSQTTVRCTNPMTNFIKVSFSNGASLTCTDYHKFYLKGGHCIPAYRLQNGDQLQQWELPHISSQSPSVLSMVDSLRASAGEANTWPEWASISYTNGFKEGNVSVLKHEDAMYASSLGALSWSPVLDACPKVSNSISRDAHTGDSSGDEMHPWCIDCLENGNSIYTPKALCASARWQYDRWITAFHDKKKLLTYMDYRAYWEDKHQNMHIYVGDRKPVEYYLTSPVNERMLWVAGVIDSCGKINGEIPSLMLQVAHRGEEFALQLVMILQSLGYHPRVSRTGHVLLNTWDTYEVFISFGHVIKIIHPSGLALCASRSVADVRVVSIEPVDETGPSYCFTEKIRGRGMFNGVVTGNCNEINIYTDRNNIGVCNLASLCLSKFVSKPKETNPLGLGDREYDYAALSDVVRTVVTNLNRVIDNNSYPVAEGEYSDKMNRPIGLGVQSLAKVFMKMRIPFTSKKAREVNRKIFETIYYAAVDQSCELAKAHGPYANYEGSLMSKGKLQFDLWGVTPSDLWDWEALRAKVSQYGVRNSLLMALMPTASTAQIMGNTESFEPITSNMYLRTTLSGTFQIINKYLVRDLKELGLWSQQTKMDIMQANGSVADISYIPSDLKQIYATVWEIKQRDLIDMEADRNAYVCQSTSSNRYLEKPTMGKLKAMHMYAWKKGLKTGMYYLRSKAAADAVKFTVTANTPGAASAASSAPLDDECLNCSA